MRLIISIVVLLLAGLCPLAAQEIDASMLTNEQRAVNEFARARDLEKAGRPEEALLAAGRAVQLAPDNIEYVTGREMLRQQIVARDVAAGNRLADTGDKSGAAAQFRAAMAVDPQNGYLEQRLRDVEPDPERQAVEMAASVDRIELAPAPGRQSFHYRGDTRGLYQAIAQAFKVQVQFDEGINPRGLRFDVDDVDFYTAVRLAGRMTRTWWLPVTREVMFVANDTQEKRRELEQMSVRTFYVGNAVAPADVTDLVNALRNIFQIQIVNAEPSRNAITIKAPRRTVDAAGEFIENLMDAKPELQIDVQEFEIDTDKASQYGLVLPTSFEVFNIYSEIYRVLGPDAQSVINQLKTTGTIDPSTIPAGDLANLQGSPLLSPFVFFGKGYGLTGISTPPISGHLSKTVSISTNTEHAVLRAVDGESVKFRVGERFPLITGTFNNVALVGSVAAQVGSTPQFTYTDLGLSINIKPHYQNDDAIRMDFEFEIQGLGTATVNNIPELTQRSFKGNITARPGEPTVITGQISEQEMKSTSGYPGIGQLPVLQAIVNSNSHDRSHNQLLIVITPHVIRKPFHDHGSSVWWNAPTGGPAGP